MNWDWMRELIKIHMVCDVVVFNGASSVLSFFATSSSLSIVSMTLKSSSSLILREILRLCRLSRMESMLCLCIPFFHGLANFRCGIMEFHLRNLK